MNKFMIFLFLIERIVYGQPQKMNVLIEARFLSMCHAASVSEFSLWTMILNWIISSRIISLELCNELSSVHAGQWERLISMQVQQ